MTRGRSEPCPQSGTRPAGARDEFVVADDDAGQRLDVVVSQRFDQFSRAHLGG